MCFGYILLYLNSTTIYIKSVEIDTKIYTYIFLIVSFVTMREQLIKALLAHANGEIQMHLANVEVYLNNPVGIGEHPDITEAMQQEIDKIARWHDQIEVINQYIKKK
tara:strand:- start:1783 stop:2103 length:321 start_codon:yes stop_codon:yes gene_type:complete